MKNIIVLFLLLNVICYSQINKLQGTVFDSQTKQPLANANIILASNPQKGTSSNTNGKFVLEGSFAVNDHLIISFIGYESRNIEIDKIAADSDYKIYLIPKIIPSQSVLVKGSIGTLGITPLAFEKITREDIEENYTTQDIPQYLSSMPSTTSYSENGNGIGYNYISIRGFDQRRISVSINGIPQNEPEDQNVYWLDFPDLLASAEMIQVQRGAGSGVFGYPAIGGSINIITSAFANDPHVNFSGYLGSYNTRKYLASFSSGLINNKYSVYAKLSRITSSGYRNLSGVKFNSYYLSAIRYDEDLTTQVNFYGGPIEDNLAYKGLPKFAIKNENLRKANYSEWNKDAGWVSYSSLMQTIVSENNDTIYAVPRRGNEIENFSQPHFELLNEFNLNNEITLNSALFLVIGDGFFDYDASWADTNYLRMTFENGFNASVNPSNALIRAKVENVQYGWIPRISISHNNGEFLAGAEIRRHKSLHWGAVRYADMLPLGATDFRYYSYNGSKDILSVFVHESYQLSDEINLLAELQLAYHKYRLFNEKFLGYDFTVDGLFLNPRAGINYKMNENQNIYLSFARVTKEPRLKNYYDAAESSYPEVPQFERDSLGVYDFNSPLVQPETMNDIELGTSYRSENLGVSLNLFYMLFEDEIVKNGELDRFGQPVTGNVDQTLHSGIEISADYSLYGFSLFANATFSRNIISDGSYFFTIKDSLGITDILKVIDLSENRISGFPDFLANFGLSFKNDFLFLQLSGRYVGAFYSDNYDDNLSSYLNLYPGFVDYIDNKNEAYFTADFAGSLSFNLFNSLDKSKIIFQVNNLFDEFYSANAIGKEFFPAGERNFLVGLQLGL